MRKPVRPRSKRPARGGTDTPSRQPAVGRPRSAGDTRARDTSQPRGSGRPRGAGLLGPTRPSDRGPTRRPARKRDPGPSRRSERGQRARPPLDPERLLARMPWGSLLPLLPGSDESRERVIERLRAFAGELLRWNRGVSNLVSRADEPRLVERHLVESLAGTELLNRLQPKKLLDFGSGGGFPALPLVLAGVGERWTLVESRRNKTLFLRRAVQELGLTGVSVVTGRLEQLLAQEPGSQRADVFTSRATLRLGPTLELAAQVVSSAGAAVLWKGSGVHEELASAGSTWRGVWSEPSVHVIGSGPNSIIVFTRL